MKISASSVFLIFCHERNASRAYLHLSWLQAG